MGRGRGELSHLGILRRLLLTSATGDGVEGEPKPQAGGGPISKFLPLEREVAERFGSKYFMETNYAPDGRRATTAFLSREC